MDIAAEKAELAKVAEDSRLKAEADLLAAQERGDIGATVQAEADAKAATKLEKVAQRPVSARAGSSPATPAILSPVPMSFAGHTGTTPKAAR